MKYSYLVISGPWANDCFWRRHYDILQI